MSKIYDHIIYDMSSLVWTCLLVGKDGEKGFKVTFEDKEVYINGFEFGYENAMNSVQAVLKKFNAVPSDLIMTFEGENSKSLRTNIFPLYKAGRERPAESYIEFNKACDLIRSVLLDLGATAVKQNGMEGDDVIAYLTLTLPGKSLVVSNDGDMTKLYSDKCDVYIGGNLNVNKYGIFPFEYTTLYKALVGDSSDNIKGAYNFGPKKFLDLYMAFDDDGLELMEQLILNKQLEKLEEDVGSLKCLQSIIDDKESVYISYALARFYPSKINTYRKPLQWTVGMVKPDPDMKDDRFTNWYAQIKGVDANNYEVSLKHFQQHVRHSPFVALDVETTTPEISDDWLEAKSKRAGADGERSGVDVLGSRLTGFSINYGDNSQYTYYFSINHKGENNISIEQARKVIQVIPAGKEIVCHNAMFELVTIFNSLGAL